MMDEKRVRVRITNSRDGRALSVGSIRSAMYQSPVLRSDPELLGVELAVKPEAIRHLAAEPGFAVEIVDDLEDDADGD
jgi:hypothetical protein